MTQSTVTTGQRLVGEGTTYKWWIEVKRAFGFTDTGDMSSIGCQLRIVLPVDASPI